MRKLITSGMLIILASTANAQAIEVTFSIDTSKDTLRISPFIYGDNSSSVDVSAGITARRLGGNRMTGYNWENNASSAGSDYQQSSDDYMTWVFGIPGSLANVPGITLTAFHDTSLAHGCYTLLTLPAAGYVARDKNGTVAPAQRAPSFRWREVRDVKGAAFASQPDTSDPFVYVDEEVNFLKSKYGAASGGRGVRGFAVDNEPALWPSTHPRIHPDTTLCRELIAKVAATARAVKSVDESAEVFGGVFYGFGEYYQMQWAPDWNAFRSYENFAAALLANLRDSSSAAGRRLLDVLDMHWYPDLYVPIINENTDSVTVFHRMQVPRSLWDSSYVENGWIGQYFHPQSAAIIRKTQRIIAQQYPGTKLAVTEFNYGGATHISGAIAMADVLGIFGANGVYFASLWGDLTGYIASAYRLYRNYDGHGTAYGNLSVSATSSDNGNSAVHAAVNTGDASTLHIIAINRNLTRSVNGHFTIASGMHYTSAAAFALLPANQQIQAMSGIGSIQGNQFTYSLPPMSVFHFVLSVTTHIDEPPASPHVFALEQNYPNPFNPTTEIRYSVPSSMDRDLVPAGGRDGQASGVNNVKLAVYDILGREVAVLVDEQQLPGSYTVRFDGKGLASGVYLCQLRWGGSAATRRLLLLK